MTNWLLKPGHMEHVVGFTAFRHFMSGSIARTSAIRFRGLWTLFEACLCDAVGWRVSRRSVHGRTRTVTWAILMALGDFLMHSNPVFCFRCCLLSGVGCFKGNLASQVGDLYRIDDPRRADGFQIYFWESSSP